MEIKKILSFNKNEDRKLYNKTQVNQNINTFYLVSKTDSICNVAVSNRFLS